MRNNPLNESVFCSSNVDIIDLSNIRDNFCFQLDLGQNPFLKTLGNSFMIDTTTQITAGSILDHSYNKTNTKSPQQRILDKQYDQDEQDSNILASLHNKMFSRMKTKQEYHENNGEEPFIASISIRNSKLQFESLNTSPSRPNKMDNISTIKHVAIFQHNSSLISSKPHSLDSEKIKFKYAKLNLKKKDFDIFSESLKKKIVSQQQSNIQTSSKIRSEQYLVKNKKIKMSQLVGNNCTMRNLNQEKIIQLRSDNSSSINRERSKHLKHHKQIISSSNIGNEITTKLKTNHSFRSSPIQNDLESISSSCKSVEPLKSRNLKEQLSIKSNERKIKITQPKIYTRDHQKQKIISQFPRKSDPTEQNKNTEPSSFCEFQSFKELKVYSPHETRQSIHRISIKHAPIFFGKTDKENNNIKQKIIIPNKQNSSKNILRRRVSSQSENECQQELSINQNQQNPPDNMKIITINLFGNKQK